MGADRAIDTIVGSGIIAVIRLDDLSDAEDLAQALVAGGINCLELTLTNRAALEVVGPVKRVVGNDAVVGIGSILDAESARTAMLAGAEFIVTPSLRLATIEICRRYSLPIIAGAMTPTEILTAWEAGANLVKVNPIRSLGPAYLRDVLAPTPQVRLVPSGGVDLDSAGEFIRAGAAAIAVGGNLVDTRLIADRRWNELTARAREYSEVVLQARKAQS